MTGYYIEVGYNSGFNKSDVSEKLEQVARSICKSHQRIIHEVERVEGIEIPESYAESYREPWGDKTIYVEERDGQKVIVQLASGGGESRRFKEAMRRAFCRIVIKEMHKEGMEVSLIVS